MKSLNLLKLTVFVTLVFESGQDAKFISKKPGKGYHVNYFFPSITITISPLIVLLL